MKNCGICDEPVKGGAVYQARCVELTTRALDMAARYCSYDGDCPACVINILDWSDCENCGVRIGIAVLEADTQRDSIQRATCWKRFFLEQAAARRCRVCSCTDMLGCPEGCRWVEEDLCSLCAEKEHDNERNVV